MPPANFVWISKNVLVKLCHFQLPHPKSDSVLARETSLTASQREKAIQSDSTPLGIDESVNVNLSDGGLPMNKKRAKSTSRLKNFFYRRHPTSEANDVSTEDDVLSPPQSPRERSQQNRNLLGAMLHGLRHFVRSVTSRKRRRRRRSQAVREQGGVERRSSASKKLFRFPKRRNTEKRSVASHPSEKWYLGEREWFLPSSCLDIFNHSSFSWPSAVRLYILHFTFFSH